MRRGWCCDRDRLDSREREGVAERRTRMFDAGSRRPPRRAFGVRTDERDDVEARRSERGDVYARAEASTDDGGAE